MQIVVLPRSQQSCRRLSSAVLCGLPWFVRRNKASFAARRTYRISRCCRAEHEQESTNFGLRGEAKRPALSSHEDALSIQALQELAPDVPYIFNSRSASPYFNLAVEHHLLTHSHPSSRILFTYTNAPCVVVGRNQNPWVECDIAAITRGTPDGRDVQLIRRRSGGGTVFHDEGNLNYTVIVPGDGFERKTHVQMVVDALLKLRNAQPDIRRWKAVKANERNDIVAMLKDGLRPDTGRTDEEEWFKVSGTAFKLTRGRALHHGTLLHSSPYIESIGTFLRSPGKAYITAKGVESVRSPVMNLWDAQEPKQRKEILDMIRKGIQQEWLNMHDLNPGAEILVTEVASDNFEGCVTELKAGIDELKTNVWRWEQTPGFSFDSRDVNAAGETTHLSFELKHGVIQSVNTTKGQQSTYEETLLQKKIHEISAPGQWREALKVESAVSHQSQEELIKLVETCFPPLQTHASGEAGEPQTLDIKPLGNIDSRQNNTHLVERGRGGEVAEIERPGSNTVVDPRDQQPVIGVVRSRRVKPESVRRANCEAERQDRVSVPDSLQSSMLPPSRYISIDKLEPEDRYSPKRTQTARRSRTAYEASSQLLEELDLHRLCVLGRDARRLTSRLARWAGQAYDLPGMAQISRRRGKPSYGRALHDLDSTTAKVNAQMVDLMVVIRDVSAPRVVRRESVVDGLSVEANEMSDALRDLSLELMKILAVSLAEQRRRVTRGVSNPRVEAESVREIEERTEPLQVSPERMSNAQKILQATLRMIDEEEKREESTEDIPARKPVRPEQLDQIPLPHGQTAVS